MYLCMNNLQSFGLKFTFGQVLLHNLCRYDLHNRGQSLSPDLGLQW